MMPEGRIHPRNAEESSTACLESSASLVLWIKTRERQGEKDQTLPLGLA